MPVDAIVNASEIDEAQRPFVELNAELARDARWPRLTQRKPPLDEHARWALVAAKRQLLQRP